MTYQWAKDLTLELLNQRSIAGAEIAPSYNNQADYLQRIPRLLDAAALTAVHTVPIPAVVSMESLERGQLGRWTTYRLPEDCRRVCCILRAEGPRLRRFHRFRLVGTELLAVCEPVGGEALLEYHRRPALLGEDPEEGAELDNTVEVQTALPYYAAAMLVMGDDAFVYAALMNQFESKLARAVPGPRAEWEHMDDAYSAEERGDDA